MSRSQKSDVDDESKLMKAERYVQGDAIFEKEHGIFLIVSYVWWNPVFIQNRPQRCAAGLAGCPLGTGVIFRAASALNCMLSFVKRKV